MTDETPSGHDKRARRIEEGDGWILLSCRPLLAVTTGPIVYVGPNPAIITERRRSGRRHELSPGGCQFFLSFVFARAVDRGRMMTDWHRAGSHEFNQPT